MKRVLVTATPTCGNDIPFASLTVSSSSGVQSYFDAASACQRKQGGVFVDGLRSVLTVLRSAVH